MAQSSEECEGIQTHLAKSEYIARSIEPHLGWVKAFNANDARCFFETLAEVVNEHHLDLLEQAREQGWDGQIGDFHRVNTLATKIASSLEDAKNASACYVLAYTGKPYSDKDMEQNREKSRKRFCDLMSRVEEKRARKSAVAEGQ